MRIVKLAATKFRRKLGLPLAIALVAVIVLDPATAGCARLKIEISATVTLVDDADNLLNNRVAPGDIIIGIYTYDSFAVDSNPLIEVADYRYTTAPNGIRLNVNGLNFGTNPADVDFLLEVVNNYLVCEFSDAVFRKKIHCCR